MSGGIPIIRTERLELAFAPKPWAFAVERRADIDAHFAQLKRATPELWNGRVLLLHEHAMSGGAFRGKYLEADFASFIAWRHWGWPETGVRDCFAAAALIASDNAVLLGVMGAHTANAGRIYFPSGTPDLDDIVDGRVDLDSSLRRELKEETGLALEEFDVAPGWVTMIDAGLIVQLKLLRSRENADALRARILTALAHQRQPELADIRIVRSARDFTPAMPAFVTAFLTDFWR